MQTELAILKLFCDSRETCEKYYPYVKGVKNLEREIKTLFSLIHDFYSRYADQNSVDQSSFGAYFDYQYPASKDRGVYRELISSAYSTNSRLDIIQDLLEQMMERHFATVMVNELIPVVEGTKYGVLPKLRKTLEDFTAQMRNPPEESRAITPYECTVAELMSMESDSAGPMWPLPSLTATIGRVRRQTNGLVFAYVDSGKTSFGVKCLTSFAQQLKDTQDIILYCGNEEAAHRVAKRGAQSAAGMDHRELDADPEKAQEILRQNGWDRIKLFDSITHTMHLEHLFKEYNPHIVFVDQGTKVRGAARGDASEVREVQELFNWYREKAKEYNLAIISLCQAVGDAENKKWLKLSDIYGSRVSIQGELDYAIGIGRVADDVTKEDVRYFHVSKNKLLNGDSVKFAAHFERHKCGWEEI